MESKDIKLKTCEIMQYTEYLDTDIKGIESRIKNLTNIKSYALVLHDKDVKDDGTKKNNHIHAVLTFSQTVNVSTIAKALHIETQYVNKIKTSTRAAQMYLIHHNAPDKYQYNADDVIASFDYKTLVEDTPKIVDIETIIKRIDNEEIKPYNLYNAVDINTYTKYKKKFNDAFEYVQRKKKGINREMRCVYLWGDSGSGKTTFAKMYAERQGYHVYVSSGGKNPLDDYQGEECIILDDIRGSVFSLADFLKLTDNNTDSLVGCRYYNKSISYCKLIICTSVQSIADLYKNVNETEKEPLKQLYRRFGEIYKLTDDTIYAYKKTDNEDDIEVVARFENPVSILYQKKKQEEMIQKLTDVIGLKLKNDDGEFVSLKDIENPFI